MSIIEKYNNLNTVFQILMNIIDDDYDDYNSNIKQKTGLIVVYNSKNKKYYVKKAKN